MGKDILNYIKFFRVCTIFKKSQCILYYLIDHADKSKSLKISTLLIENGFKINHFAIKKPVLYTKNHHFQQPFVKPEGEHMTNVLFRSIFPSYIEYSYCSQ